ncbi:MAG TPA: hypothetical protein VG940_00075 [Gemmatimonadales bacterium]|nr:hypothetical protein [Gemmatimonadales bacterium]
MTDDPKDEPVLDPRLMAAARARHEPPPVPREELWTRIQAARRGGPAATAGLGTARWRRPHVLVPVAIAATLILGIILGRLWIPLGTGVKHEVAGATPDSAGKARKEDLFARYAAEQTLGQAEVLLTQYRSDAAAGAATTTTPDEARKLLLATRLLLDAPTLSDPRLRDLLEDLELVLAQIAEGSQVKEDRAVITDGLDRHDVLPRLRAATVNTGIQLPGAI